MKSFLMVVVLGVLVLGAGCRAPGAKTGDGGFDQNRFIKVVSLPQGGRVVVAEGDYEPRSLGSYSVRFYGADNPEFPFDDYRDGIVKRRPDGFIEKVQTKDIDGDGRAEVIVIFRCVGTGCFVSAEAFGVAGRKLTKVASLEGLRPKADTVKLLAFQVKPAPVGTAAWFEAIEEAVGVSDDKGHGPTVGSGEWMMAVDKKVFYDKDTDERDMKIGSRKWMEVVHMILFRKQ